MERTSSLPQSQEPATCPFHEPDQCSPHPTSHLLKIHFDMTLPSMPRPFTWSLSLRSPTKTLYAPIQSPIRVTCSANLILLHLIIRISSWAPYSRTPSSYVPLSMWDTKFHTTQDNRQNSSYVYLNLYNVWQQAGKQKIPHWMTASFPWLQSLLNFFINEILIYYYYYYYYYYYHHHHHHQPRYLLYAGYLHLYSWDKPCPYGTLCCNYSDVTIRGAYIASSCVDSVVSLR